MSAYKPNTFCVAPGRMNDRTVLVAHDCLDWFPLATAPTAVEVRRVAVAKGFREVPCPWRTTVPENANDVARLEEC